MQSKQAEAKNVRRVGVEEEQIKFRPSPNFKNMKKFLKSRSDYSESRTLANSMAGPSTSIDQNATERQEVKPVVPPPYAIAAAPNAVVVQPPLPPYPPPQSPPFNVTIKQEREDVDEEAQNNSRGEGELIQDIQPAIMAQQALEQSQIRPKKTICKEFIRGNCKRPVCKYAHEVDVSQLAGVFTFCWNYQNDVCTFPNCRFVHASVFEEAEFYRTGVLPPHARSHLKKQQMPPPPPPEEIRPQMSFPNPPPMPIHPSMGHRLQMDNYRGPFQRSISPPKREWSELVGFNMPSPRQLEPNDQMAKKCKNCDVMEFRLKYSKDVYENNVQSLDEKKKNVALLNRKNNRLCFVLNTIVKSGYANKSTIGNGFISSGEKEKLMFEQQNSFAGPSRMSSLFNDEPQNNMHLKNLLAKLLLSGGEPPLPSDNSPKP